MSQHAPNTPNGHSRETSQHAPDAHRRVNDTAAGMSEPIRVTVDEAAKLLGTSANALRKRIERGTIQSEKVDGVRYVILSAIDMPQHASDVYDSMSHDSVATSRDSAVGMSSYITSLEDQVDYLRRQLEVWQEEARRKDHILAALTERIPELEPAREDSSEHQREPVSHSDTGSSDDEVSPQEPERRSWWRRLFEG
jgi:excisionase family DNA binding protein